MSSIDREELKEKIKNAIGNKYEGLLTQIEGVAKELWSSKTRLIPYFTDHGLDHSYRIIYYLFRILELKEIELTRDEYFILFSSAYLHDIGMQCDLNKHITVKEKLWEKRITKLNFNHKSSDYTSDEINELRRIHNEVTYWWIIEASQEKSSYVKFNTAMKEINNSMIVQDIADICLYHTKRSIYKIEDVFKHNKENGRKKAITSLFRLADELDVDSRRVDDILELENFSYNEVSAFIWWLHSRIQISFDKFGNIEQTVNLHYDDKGYEEIVLKKLEKDLNTKNKKLISLMNKEGFLDISIKPPKCEFSDAFKKIPKNYQDILIEEQNQIPKEKKKVLIHTDTIISSIYHNSMKICCLKYGKETVVYLSII